MTIAPELSARILRLYDVERWRVGTISRLLCVHRDTVHRVLAQSGLPTPSSPLRPSCIDPYRPFILETLTKFPELTATRLFGMVSERGYRGSGEHFRHLIAGMRPRPVAEAYLRLRTLPGEQMQCDWGHFGHLQIGRARRPLMAFVMVLSYSRFIFLRFFLDARMDSFLRGHAEAFRAFNGVGRVVLYDNLRSAVLERQGDAIRFNPALLEFAAHYRYEPRPVAVARGNEKEWGSYCLLVSLVQGEMNVVVEGCGVVVEGGRGRQLVRVVHGKPAGARKRIVHKSTAWPRPRCWFGGGVQPVVSRGWRIRLQARLTAFGARPHAACLQPEQL